MITEEMRDLLPYLIEAARLDNMTVSLDSVRHSVTITVMFVKDADFEELQELVDGSVNDQRVGGQQ